MTSVFAFLIILEYMSSSQYSKQEIFYTALHCARQCESVEVDRMFTIMPVEI